MIKLTILIAIAAFFFLRKAKWSSGWIGSILKKISVFFIFFIVFWWSFKAFGPSSLIVYTDSFGIYKVNKKEVLVGWEQFSLFPLDRNAKAVFVQSDLDKTIRIPDKYLKHIHAAYPYPYEEKFILKQYYFIVGLLMFLTLYFSRNPKINKQWEETVTLDRKNDYEEFILWSKGNVVRKMYTIKQRSKAIKSIKSIKQRNTLKLDAYASGWKAKGLNNTFLKALKHANENNITDIGVSIFYKGNEVEFDPETISEGSRFGMLLNVEETHIKLREYYKEFLDENPMFRSGTGASMFLASPEHLQFLPPDKDSGTQVVEKQFCELLNRGVSKFISRDCVQFTKGKKSSERMHLDVEFDCFIQTPYYFFNKFKHFKKKALLGGGAGPAKVNINGKEYEGGPVSTYKLGMIFTWNLYLDDSVILTGKNTTYPDSSISNRFGDTSTFIDKKQVSIDIFEGVSFSNLSNLFSQWMGVPFEQANTVCQWINATSVKASQEFNEKTNELTVILEDSLRQSTYEEILKMGADEVYKANQESIDNLIVDYIKSSGEPDTILQLVEMYGEYLPNVTQDIVGLLMESLNEDE